MADKSAVKTDSKKTGMQDNKKKALELAVAQIEKQFGKGSIMRLGERTHLDVEVIPTGAVSLDLALGVGGVPRGRVVEIFGPESSGKTTLTLSIIAQAQKQGGVAAFIDAEHAFDPSYARVVGVNVSDLLVSQPDTGEQALEIAETLVRSNAIDVIVIDSVAALVPKAEIEGNMGDSFIGLQARLMSQALRKLTGTISKTRTCVLFINQIREKIGVMFGNPETTPGGRALKFYSSVRIDLRRISPIKKGDQIIGNVVRAKIVKNKVAPPFREAEFEIYYDRGIDFIGSLIDASLKLGLISRSGAWYSLGDVKLGQGKDSAISYLNSHPDVVKKLLNAIGERLRGKQDSTQAKS